MKKSLLILVILIAAAACIAGCTTPQPPVTPTPTATQPPATTVQATSTPAAPTVLVGSNPTLGSFLTTASGRTLYYFALDVPGSGTSACNSTACMAAWTPFTAGTVTVNTPLDPGDFSSITVNGTRQITYYGWPMYLYNGDAAAGDTKGDGVGGVWYVMKPEYTVMIMKNAKVGSYLSDVNGNTLYNFSIDANAMTTCFNSTSDLIQGKTCIQLWPAFGASTITVPSGLNPADFKSFPRSDGTLQTAYKGWPLYYFLGDTAPGQTNGEAISGFGGIWHVVAPNAATAPTAYSGSGGGGGGGY